MPTTTPNETNLPSDKIEFIQHHLPAFTLGKYQIEVKQEIKITNENKISPSFYTKRYFTVSGDRSILNPQDIHAVFPPAGSLGEHSNVLPHIILNRSTLPWERSDTDSKDIPWLALLLFEEGEKLGGTIDKQAFLEESKKYPDINGEAVWNHLLTIKWLKLTASNPNEAIILFQDKTNSPTLGNDFAKWESTIGAIVNQFRTPKIIPIEQLINPSTDSLNWPGIQLEIGQIANDRATIIDLPNSILKNILPTKEDLAYLAHVRQGKDNNGNSVGDELAVIIGNRLPKKGGISTVHLVSVEGLYNNYQSAADDDLIRLVSLKSWSFACIDEKQSFKELLKKLNREPSTLRLPKNNNPNAEQYLKMGYVPLPHYLRQGDKTISWYHSPLVPGENTTKLANPVRAADELIRYNPANGMFDVSYAAAWELGRLLALQSKDFSIKLYNWKRAYAQQCCQKEQECDCSHLPGQTQPTTVSDSVEIPEAIASWFKDLSLLKGVPFNYLVPDEKMLPQESIRFFWVNPFWIECLLDGAFSIGRVTTADHKRDCDCKHITSPATNPYQKVSGFLLRSDVVAGWPGLLVDGYNQIINDDSQDSQKKELKILRMERLSPNVLFCLFEGEVKTVDIHQKPETLHFGLDFHDGNSSFYKKLKNREGQSENLEIKETEMAWRDKNKRTLDIESLVGVMKNLLKYGQDQKFTSAQFALEMIERVEKVRFTKLSI